MILDELSVLFLSFICSKEMNSLEMHILVRIYCLKKSERVDRSSKLLSKTFIICKQSTPLSEQMHLFLQKDLFCSFFAPCILVPSPFSH